MKCNGPTQGRFLKEHWNNAGTIKKMSFVIQRRKLLAKNLRLLQQQPELPRVTQIMPVAQINASSSNKCQEHLFQIQPCLN